MPQLVPQDAVASHQKLYGLDHLRALAIILVFFFHYFILSNGEPSWLPDVASFGWIGVDLFFVLSGFLISSQLFEQVKTGTRISFGNFFLKRFFRIIPAFWFTLILYFCIPFFREKEALSPLWKFLTFTQNLGLDLKDYGTFSHAWSLCVEEHFYLFLPLTLILLQTLKGFRKAYWLLIVLVLLGFAVRIYSYDHLFVPRQQDENPWVYWYKYVYYPTWNRLDGLLAGVAIAGMYHFYPKLWSTVSRYGNYLILSGLLLLTGAYFLSENQQSYAASVFVFPLVALGFGCIVAGAVSPSGFLYKWQSKTTTFIATISYAVYLTHKGVIHMTHQLLADFEINNNIMLLICIVTCTIAAVLLNLVIEKPFLKLRNKILKKEKNTTVLSETIEVPVLNLKQ
jgi:peptidoglycan/LPS O-acetylase OafA/YrhL